MPEGCEWPRYESGEPVRFLDDFERDGDENGVSAVTMYTDGSFALNFRAYSKGERVKRPAPKVLDADGAEIRVGDTVWTDYGDGPWTVTNITTANAYHVYGHSDELGSLDMPPSTLTHRAPVLAADGRPLCEGETVWSVNTGEQLEVSGFDGDYVKCRYEGVAHGIPVHGLWHARELTHERPDSWDRLEEDAGKNPFDYCKDVCHRLDTCENSEAYKARDLVRRAKALAGRGQ